MNRTRARWLSAAVAFLILLLAGAALSWGQRYRALAAQRDATEHLALLAGRLGAVLAAELERVAAGAGPSGLTGERYRWRTDGTEFELDRRVDDAALIDGLQRALAATPGALVRGPIATLDGIDMLIIGHAFEPGGGAGVMVRVIDLIQAAGLLEYAQRGHSLRVSWADDPAADVFRSHPGAPDAPVTARTGFPGGEWLLASEPLAGWSPLAEAWPLAVIGGLLAFLVGAGFFVLADKPGALRAEIGELEQRLAYTHEDLERSLNQSSQIERRLHTVTSLDAESGLSNRRTFGQLLADELKALREQLGGLSVVVVRLSMLTQVAAVIGARRFFARLAEALDELCAGIRPRPFQARLSDLELALCLPRQTDPTALEELADALCRCFGGDFEAGGERFDLHPAVGIAVAEDGYRYADELIDGALLAAGEARGRGERRWVIYDPQIRESRTSMLQLEAQIGQAIDANQFRLYCQPIVRTCDRALAGFETLLRWRHPVEGLLAPGRFLSIAEGSRHMPRLSRWCIDEVVRLATEWLNLREAPFYLSVNLTASDLERVEFVAEFAQRIAETEVPGERVRVEVTEREIIKDLSTIARATAELEERGIHVLLDDFGTGFSSLTHLRVFRFHTVKIDRSFVASMVDDPKDLALVTAIVDLVHDLGMECVAEGVETEAQLAILKQVGCDYCQGYLFGRPAPPADVPAIVARFPVPARQATAAG